MKAAATVVAASGSARPATTSPASLTFSSALGRSLRAARASGAFGTMSAASTRPGMASNLDEALAIARRIGYPLMVRPSYVLGGRGMEIVYDEEMLTHYVAAAVDVTPRGRSVRWRTSQNSEKSYALAKA